MTNVNVCCFSPQRHHKLFSALTEFLGSNPRLASRELKSGCTLSIHSTDSWQLVFTCGLASSRGVKQSGPRVSGRHFAYNLSRRGTTLEG